MKFIIWNVCSRLSKNEDLQAGVGSIKINPCYLQDAVCLVSTFLLAVGFFKLGKLITLLIIFTQQVLASVVNVDNNTYNTVLGSCFM